MKLSHIAQKLNGHLDDSQDDVEIVGLAGLVDACEGDLSFLANPRYASAIEHTRASAVLVTKTWEGTASCAVIRVENPDRSFAEAAQWLAPPPVTFEPMVHPTAVIASQATIGENVYIGPHCVVEEGAVIGDRSILVAGCYLGHEARIGEQCRLYARVSIRERCVLGNRVIVHDGAVIGCDGFGYTPDAQGAWQKIPQVGIVTIGDDVEIGANVTIDRARFGKTRIAEGVKIDNLVQIAHNVQVEEHSVMASQVGISGSTRIGKRVQLGGQAGLAGHLTVGDGAIVGAQAGVTKSVDKGAFVSGYPAMDHRKATRIHAHLMRLPEWKARVRELEDALKALRENLPS